MRIWSLMGGSISGKPARTRWFIVAMPVVCFANRKKYRFRICSIMKASSQDVFQEGPRSRVAAWAAMSRSNPGIWFAVESRSWT